MTARIGGDRRERRWLVALASLPGMGPARLATVLDGRTPEEAWAHVGEGAERVPEPVAARWRERSGTADVDGLWRAHVDAGVRVLRPGDEGWPVALDDDPEPPAILFARGEPRAAIDGVRVAIIGTRRCSYGGRQVARDLGYELSEAGICVVSGLALGIDGAAHVGALAGATAPVGVVATGLDVVYPRRHRDLWISETWRR